MVLEWPVVGLVLLAAVLHASWNAVNKASSDPLLNMAIIGVAGGAASALVMLFVPAPGAEAWPFLGTSVVIHFAYQIFLVRAYGLGDLSQVYPIARGLAPLGVALLAMGFAGEVPTPHQGVGLLLACGAIASLGWIGSARRSPNGAVSSAVVTALLISAYTLVDGQGVRTTPNPLSYIAWIMFLDSFPILVAAVVIRREKVMPFVRAEGLHAAAGGVMAVVGYGIVLWAMTRGAMAPISALRETSVVFAALIGARVLGEPFGRPRVVAAVTLALGLVLVQI